MLCKLLDLFLNFMLVSKLTREGEASKVLKWTLRERMKERRISNKMLAERMGVHRNTIRQLKEDQPTMIRLRHLELLCQVLDCQPSDLFELSPESAGVTSGT
jgi:putative transcriptional regulator